MKNLPIDPNLMPLINGVKPYLGTSARNYADMFSSTLKLLSSNSGREVITTMGRILAPNVKGTVSTETNKGLSALLMGPGPSIAFSLFLILVLLIFATGGLGWADLMDAADDEVNTPDNQAEPGDAIDV